MNANLARVAAILHESFDPIIDLTTGQDLLPVMVYAQELGAWDYTGMYSAVLQHQVRRLRCLSWRMVAASNQRGWWIR